MFPYDPAILATLTTTPNTIADVIQTMQNIDGQCVDADGLKWFNWLYLQVTQAVQSRVQAGGFNDPSWMADLDVHFARLYFSALKSSLSGQPAPSCWATLFDKRDQASLARIQCALAGINAHINHDLPEAIVNTGSMTDAHYADYTALNTTLDSLIELAKKTLMLRLLGDPLPPVSQLEDIVAAWSITAVRQTAWQNAQILAHVATEPALATNFVTTLDVLTTAANQAILIPVSLPS